MQGNEKNIIQKKYIKIAALVILTIFLLLVFRQSKNGIFVIENRTNSLLSKYTHELMPLNQQKKLENEDIVNFALYGNIPIDKANEKILIINSDETGNKKFVITKAKLNYDTKNYEYLIKHLNLKPVEKLKFDSMLSKYRSKLSSSILLDAKETYAINPSVITLQNELNNNFKLIIKKSFLNNRKKILQAFEYGIKAADSIELNKNFIFINPDTVLNLVTKKGIKKKIQLGDKNPVSNLEFSFEQNKNDKLKIDFQLNDNFVFVNIPQMQNDLGEKLSKQINKEVRKELKDFNDFLVQRKNEKKIEFKFNIEKLPPTVVNDLKRIDKDILQKLEKLNIRIDSLGMNIKIIQKDTLRNKFRND